MNETIQYTEAEKKQIEIFGHVLPKTGGTYKWENGKLIPTNAPAQNLEDQGFLKQPTNLSVDEVATTAAVKAAAAILSK